MTLDDIGSKDRWPVKKKRREVDEIRAIAEKKVGDQTETEAGN